MSSKVTRSCQNQESISNLSDWKACVNSSNLSSWQNNENPGELRETPVHLILANVRHSTATPIYLYKYKVGQSTPC